MIAFTIRISIPLLLFVVVVFFVVVVVVTIKFVVSQSDIPLPYLFSKSNQRVFIIHINTTYIIYINNILSRSCQSKADSIN